MADLSSVIVGGAIGIAGSFGPLLWQQRQSRLALRASVRASIYGILDMYATRDFAGIVRRSIDGWTAGTQNDWPSFAGSADLREDPILHRLGEKVGLLGNDAADVVAFTNIITGIDLDLRAIVRGELDHLTTPDRIRLFERDLTLWHEAERLGGELIRRLEHKSWLGAPSRQSTAGAGPTP
jgi:hypothetical protein